MQKTYTTLTIIFTAFLSSVFVYLMIGYFLKTSQHQQPGFAPHLTAPLFYLLLVVSFGNLILAQVIKQRSFANGAPRFDTPEKLHTYITSRYIVTYALSEVPAICGLVYLMLTGLFWRMALFVALSLVSFILVKPSLPDLEDFQGRNSNRLQT